MQNPCPPGVQPVEHIEYLWKVFDIFGTLSRTVMLGNHIKSQIVFQNTFLSIISGNISPFSSYPYLLSGLCFRGLSFGVLVLQQYIYTCYFYLFIFIHCTLPVILKEILNCEAFNYKIIKSVQKVYYGMDNGISKLIYHSLQMT